MPAASTPSTTNPLFSRRNPSSSPSSTTNNNNQNLRVFIPPPLIPSSGSISPRSYSDVNPHGYQDEDSDHHFQPMNSSSPRIDTFIPSSQLNLFSTEDDQERDTGEGQGEGEGDGRYDDGDQDEDAGDAHYAEEQMDSYISSTSSDQQRPPYAGLGLGLPFSLSASAALSSLSPSSNYSNPPSPSSHINLNTSLGGSGGAPGLPQSTSGTSLPRSTSYGNRSLLESPVADRSRLIGLGELATPRWTSDVLERRWGEGERSRQETDESQYADYPDQSTESTHILPFPSPPTTRPSLRTFASSVPSSGSSSSVQQHPTGLIDFNNPNFLASSSTPSSLSDVQLQSGLGGRGGGLRRESSAYSLDAVSIPSDPEDQPTSSKSIHLPPSYSSDNKRASVGAASSAPNSAGWSFSSVSPQYHQNGLGFDSVTRGSEAVALATAVLNSPPPSPGKRISSSTGASSVGSASRRSIGESTTAGSPRSSSLNQHQRRQSGGGAVRSSSFAHLPPSPAAIVPSPSASSPRVSSQSQTQPLPSPRILSQSQTSPRISTSSSGGRNSSHHHSSPSTIAASILRHTRETQSGDVERDQGTEEALRKLDGLGGTSPRISRDGSVGAVVRGRTSSKGNLKEEEGTVMVARRRTRSSVSSAAALMSDIGGIPPPTPTSTTIDSPIIFDLPFPPKSPSSTSTSRSPLSPQSSHRLPTTRPTSASETTVSNTTTSSAANSPFKRGSSSSSTFPTSTRDSTSGTSTSWRSVNSSSTNSKQVGNGSGSGGGGGGSNRRGSVSSEASSVHSFIQSSSQHQGQGGESGSESAGEEMMVTTGGNIPPVPPIPKDWENFRPPTASLNSPGFGFDPFDSSTTSSMVGSGFGRRPSVDSNSYHSAQHQQHPYATSVAMVRGDTEENLIDTPNTPGNISLNEGGGSLSRNSFHRGEGGGLRAPEMETSSSSNSLYSQSGGGVGTPSATKTPTRKWSISGAFSKSSSNKSPRPPSVKESTSYTDLLITNRVGGGNHTSLGVGEQIAFPKRMAASTNDIVGLSGPGGGGGYLDYELKSIRGTASSMMSRPRTASISSISTTRTGGTTGTQQQLPQLVTTSPNRSRSSMLSPRRTPSGIPFFSRKASGNASSPSPNFDQSSNNNSVAPAVAQSAEDKVNGRKSILGLNIFTRGGSAKKDKEKAGPPPPSPNRTKRQTFTSATAASSSAQKESSTDEFSRRASVAAKTSSLITRKRGKTMSGSVADPPPDARPLTLPPMQMSALSPSTIKRVDSLSSSISSKASSLAGSTRIQPPLTRAAPATKLQESVKANLPPIAGSPSTHAFPTVQDKESSPLPHRLSQQSSPTAGSSPPPKSHTPTKIPRYQRTTASHTAATMATVAGTDPSPRQLGARASDNSLNGSQRGDKPPVQSKSSRRLSYYGATPEGNSTGNRSSLSTSVSSGNVTGSDLSTSTTTPDFGILREPGLSLGEKSLSSRRRLDSEPSHIPRSRSTTTSTSQLKSGLESSKDSLAARLSLTSATSGQRGSATRRQSLLAGEDAKQLAAQALSSSSSSSSRTTTATAAARTSLQAPRGISDSAIPSVAGAAPPPLRRVLGKTSEPPMSSSSSSSIASSSRRASATVAETGPKSARAIASKVGAPARMPKSSTTGVLAPSSATDSGRSSSNSQYGPSEEELRGDEEMSAYVRRQQSKKLAAGIPSETIRKMFEFPDPTEPLPPLDARDALSLYGRYLSEYEKEEIRDYPDVYFVGPNSEKKPATKDNPTNNYGYDDERGDYLLVPNDHIRFRYQVIDVLGKGSFGQVLQCRDHRTGEMVAIKIIRNKKRFHHQALVEIKVLENLVKWDPDEKHYVIRMVDSFTFRGHLCIVTELLSINLYELVKANSFAGFTTTLIRRFTTQILGSLILLRHHRVVHCDLKPENILLKHPAKSAIKVIDFGSSCFEHEKVYTYIQSRFYRSPEVILGMNYHMAIDMWSLGCIIAEMYTGYPIFPGENEQEQLSCIMEVMGLPDKYLIDRSSRKRLFFDSTGAPRPVVNSKGRRRRPGTKTLAQVLKSDDELFVDFIAKCLTWDPDRRLKPDPALRHPWILAARTRPVSPTATPARSSRSSSAAPSTFSSGTSTISTPRRKVGSSTTASATPIHSQHTTPGAATAPTQRTRTTSIAAVPAPKLTSFGSLQIPNTSTRYSVKS